MEYFMCCSCGYLLKLNVEEGAPPNECPSCQQAGAFVNVTSYRPDIGEGKADEKIMALLLEKVEAWNRAKVQPAGRAQGLMTSRVDALCREAALMALRDLLEQKRKAGLLRERELAVAQR